MSAEEKTDNFVLRAGRIIPEPGSAALEDALLIVRQGRVHALGTYADLVASLSQWPRQDMPVYERQNDIVVPGLINAHTHIELSHMQGRTLRGAGFTAWIRSMLAGGLDDVSSDAVYRAAQELSACGTALVVDITSRQAALVARALEDAGVGAFLAAEYFGYSNTREDFLQGKLPGGAQDIAKGSKAEKFAEQKNIQQVVLAGHALYSTPGEMLQEAKACNEQRGVIYPLHLAEHEQETQMLVDGTGEFADLLRQGVIPAEYCPPKMRPVAWADSLGLLNERTLAVHCVQVNREDIAILRQRDVAVCLCPRSNEFIGVGRAPWEEFDKAGLRICLGTDGLCSNTDLNVWNEAAMILENSQTVTFDTVLSWMTTVPAQVLGLAGELGTLRPGMRACFSAVPEHLHAAVGNC